MKTVKTGKKIQCQSLVNASAVPLTSAGFASIQSHCCVPLMVDFIERLVKQDSSSVCSIGALNGFAPYYACPGAEGFSDLQADIGPSSPARTGTCPLIKDSSASTCPTMHATCPNFPGAPSPSTPSSPSSPSSPAAGPQPVGPPSPAPTTSAECNPTTTSTTTTATTTTTTTTKTTTTFAEATIDIAGGGWRLAATFSRADGVNSVWHPRTGKWTTNELFGDCTSMSKADCRSEAWNNVVTSEILVKEDSGGDIGIRSWTLKQSDTLYNIFQKSQENIASASTLIQASGSTHMGLAYENQAGYLLVNTDVTGNPYLVSKCTTGIDNCLSTPAGDGCRLVGFWHRQNGGIQCSSGIGCVVDNGVAYDCDGDVATNNAGASDYNGGQKDDHTVWMFVRPAV